MIRFVDLLKTQRVTLDHYKIHLATGVNPTPLEAYFNGAFKEWQEDQTKKNFECSMVLSLIHLGTDRWLFAGVYGIRGVEQGQKTAFKYDTELLPGHDELIGRVIIRYKREYRASYIWGHKYGNKLEVSEVLDSPLSIEPFPGYNGVCISHNMLKLIQQKEEPSWKAALSSVGGVYVIMDTATGKPYVGSAYGDCGLWQRWRAYVESGHGGNTELKNLLSNNGADYAANFQYSVLEIADPQSSADYVCARESHWKEVLLSRKFGYNSN
jgi:hypothetical protein